MKKPQPNDAQAFGVPAEKVFCEKCKVEVDANGDIDLCEKCSDALLEKALRDDQLCQAFMELNEIPYLEWYEEKGISHDDAPDHEMMYIEGHTDALLEFAYKYFKAIEKLEVSENG